MSEVAAPPRARSDAIDIARALSLVAMTGYHLTWDLAYFHFIAAHAPFTPPMRFASHAIGSSFLFLVGVSLALAHRRGTRWCAYFGRIGKIAAAAALVTVGSIAFAPDYAIWFGILHCVVAASLIAALFLSAPVGVATAAGIAAIVIGASVQSDAFNPPALAWLGLGTDPPWTLDWRPLLPWAGATWIGLDITRVLRARFATAPFWTWRGPTRPARALAWLGRHSLAYYLLHQLVLFGILYPVAWALGPLPG